MDGSYLGAVFLEVRVRNDCSSRALSVRVGNVAGQYSMTVLHVPFKFPLSPSVCFILSNLYE